MNQEEEEVQSYELQYFPASIIEQTSANGDTFNELRVFRMDKGEHDPEIPDEAHIKQLRLLAENPKQLRDGTHTHPGPKVLFCITMYQEEWYQILQSVAGCIRSVLELEEEDPEKYGADKFGIVLICGKSYLCYSF